MLKLLEVIFEEYIFFKCINFFSQREIQVDTDTSDFVCPGLELQALSSHVFWLEWLIAEQELLEPAAGQDGGICVTAGTEASCCHFF